jgi:hypothetical protein
MNVRSSGLIRHGNSVSKHSLQLINAYSPHFSYRRPQWISRSPPQALRRSQAAVRLARPSPTVRGDPATNLTKQKAELMLMNAKRAHLVQCNYKL